MPGFKYFLIKMCFPTNMNTRSNPTPPVLTTAKAAKTPSHLENLSKQVCKATLERKLFEMLKEKEIGTPALENQALRL